MIANRSQLFTMMQNKATVITPNNRLSSELINNFFRSNPKPIQDKPLCLPYTAFLHLSFKKLCYSSPKHSHPFVLTIQQCHFLWRRILAKSSQKSVNEGLLLALEEAWTRCHLWQLDFSHPSFTHTPQTSEFQLWALELQDELNKMGAITEVQLAGYLLEQRFHYQYKELIWACFDDYTPQQTALQNYFSKQRCQNFHYDLSEETSHPYCFTAKDSSDEYQQLIYWLKERLAHNEKSIAVIVPNLQSEAKPLKRLLQQQLGAQFNISFGQSLSEFPLVSDALCWLELDEEKMSVYQAQLLLHSPYLAFSQTEMLARAQFREDSKILQELYFTKAALVKELQGRVPKLAELLKNLVNYPQNDSLQAWIRHFKNRLRTLGFPGEYSLNSDSYQCYQRLLTLFDEFREFALVNSEMTKFEAFSLFKNLAKSTIFQAKSAAAKIQVLGLLEAAGCTFDSLWVTGLTDLCLPQKAKLSAFIPISLQREKLMPYASPARELKLAQKVLGRLGSSSQHVVFSYPLLSDDKPNLPSPLIANFPSFPAYELTKNLRPFALVNFVETYEIPFGQEEKVAGGTAILANQAKCPFRAFATHRLHAKANLAVSDGPDAKERGQLIHKVMELLWQSLQNQKTLLTMAPQQLDKAIEQAICQSLEPIIQQRPYSFSTLIQEVELVKLKHLVHACLDWERQRPAFEVEALEEAFTMHLAGIDFKVRVDRLDKLEDGSKWIIDYKSSLPTSMPWKEERPKEPQLLLYALLDETINGLLFAQLKAGQLTCKGFSAENHSLPGLSTLKKDEEWIEYREHWKSQLNELAEEFSQGKCQPQPSSAAVCQLCDLQNLCRFVVK
ncbi:MAG: PD-(D/E)XK nuclease family protein [Tatlockia sp.]|nr:PD-(D/E)XK nuclease family protein [Tatlockia sp.]